ncbi:DUF4235 domain-containing protein [Cellulomonas dongxiuzhuiae]|uniref:DUF4235 domain-containing protein n=1 Tax=Cellulomonas dongxiuzhuiae TaxID=2819979 RepID=A0ABX8GK43_9CELL|nr:DUF4235 domain-containing protein [Cellulomonas dongxiuzhuiae]MBO3089685.1 DUF4235 domain-containing protein [Cellulomonas dongxiuzhuiae]MBO3095318.1 DUF4235 domain-containing protein [Cellulomonas dongxiuzhuiae]QWC16308.1 DUF4235 domain-containing protein [Cellulomonas dongxiuzhuiae]
MTSDEKKQSMSAKIVGAVVALAATWVVHRVIDSVWEKTRGHKPPAADSSEDDINFGEVAAAAAVTGAAIGLSRVLATRGAAKIAARIVG